ncbi:cupin-like domain-containing protein [Paraburkholderia agricolaris]|uniref:Cupin-like domain-containing protein n=1 Tax=Paraburkholderia agricolaris TaxID=2152888 RepID=A0ABW9A376_9BURK
MLNSSILENLPHRLNGAWKKQPLNLVSIGGFEADEVFSVLKQGVEMFRAGIIPQPAKLFINGNVADGIEGAFPAGRDHTHIDYDGRLVSELHADTYLLHAFDMRPYDRYFDKKVTALSDTILSQLDPEGTYGPVVAEIFMGRYGETVGGIHKERCSTLHFVLSGEKRIRLWPEDTWSTEDERVRYSLDERTGEEEHYLLDARITHKGEKAIDLIGKAGDVFYWPQGWWHVGSSIGFSISMTIAFHPHREA